MYWPAIGTLRADVVKERVRTTVLNLFRVPLNLFVCLLLLNVGTLDVGTIFMLCAMAQGTSLRHNCQSPPVMTCLSIAMCTLLSTQLAFRSTLTSNDELAASDTSPDLKA
jgi:hypothetical protein